MKKLNKKGFTLIELIVVIAILAILAAILIPAIVNYIGTANERKDLTNSRSAYSAASLEVAANPETYEGETEAFFTINGVVSATASDCTATLTNGSISAFSCVTDTGTYALSDGEMTLSE